MKALLRKWLKIEPSKQVRVEIIEGRDLTLNQWKDYPELINEAYKLTQTPIFKQMLACLDNESPAHYKLPKLGIQPTDRISHLGEIEGYQLAINNLLAMAKEPIKEQPLTATFQPETEDEHTDSR